VNYSTFSTASFNAFIGALVANDYFKASSFTEDSELKSPLRLDEVIAGHFYLRFYLDAQEEHTDQKK
jgi:hypothetical protein